MKHFWFQIFCIAYNWFIHRVLTHIENIQILQRFHRFPSRVARAPGTQPPAQQRNPHRGMIVTSILTYHLIGIVLIVQEMENTTPLKHSIWLHSILTISSLVGFSMVQCSINMKHTIVL